MSSANKTGPTEKDSIAIRLLLDRAMEGHAPSIEILFKGYRPRVRSYCSRFLKNHDAAEDATQDTFIIVSLSIGKLKDPARFEAWLFTVARRACARQQARVKQPENEVRLDQMDGETIDLPAPGPSPEDIAISRSQIEAMYRELTPAELAVVKIRAEEGQTFEQIAVWSRLLPGTVRQRYSRAIKRLQKIFGSNESVE